MEESSKKDGGGTLQDFRSPSNKRSLEIDGSNDILNPQDHPGSSKESDQFVDELTDSAKDSPSKEGVLRHHRATDLEQQGLESLSKKQKLDSQLAEERHFYNILKNVLDKVKDKWKVSDQQIEEAIDGIRRSFHYPFHQFSEVDLSKPYNICGYLFRLGTLGAGLVRFRCLQAFQNCSILEHMLRKTELRVVCLGGGPGNDIVGFLSALHEVRELKGCRLEVSVVDAAPAWKDCVDFVNNEIHDEKHHFGNVSQICRENTVNVLFYETTLPCKPDDSCYESLKNADIILISKLISIVETKSEIMENVKDLIQNTSLVLFIDSPFFDEMTSYFESLYQSEKRPYNLCHVNERFNSYESQTSKAFITVLRKKILY